MVLFNGNLRKFCAMGLSSSLTHNDGLPVRFSLRRKAGQLLHEFHHLKPVVKLMNEITFFAGAIVLFWGVILAAVNGGIVVINSVFEKEIPIVMGLSNFSTRNTKKVATMGQVRDQLGEITAFGLEILVVGDILETLAESTTDQSWNALGKLAVVAAFRTALAYCLSKEVDEIEEKIHREEEQIHGVRTTLKAAN